MVDFELESKFKLIIHAAKSEQFIAFEKLVGGLTPNQCVELERFYENEPETLGQYWAPMLWATSDTWGFEISWAHFYRLDPEEQAKHKDELDPPPLHELTPDIPLCEHEMWGPRDRGILGLELALQGKTFADVFDEAAEQLGLKG